MPIFQMFPQKSTLDPKVYGDHTCTITREDIADKLDGLTVEQVYIYIHK